MGKTNPVAKQLRTPRYRKKVVGDKRITSQNKQAKKEIEDGKTTTSRSET